MKAVIGLGLFFMVSTAFATEAQPLLVKYDSSGLTQIGRYVKCEIFADHVAITRSLQSRSRSGLITTTETKAFTVAGSIRELIREASSDKVSEAPNGLCDGPSSEIKAVMQTGSVDASYVLYQTGGCGSPKQERIGTASGTLQMIVRDACPNPIND